MFNIGYWAPRQAKIENTTIYHRLCLTLENGRLIIKESKCVLNYFVLNILVVFSLQIATACQVPTLLA